MICVESPINRNLEARILVVELLWFCQRAQVLEFDQLKGPNLIFLKERDVDEFRRAVRVLEVVIATHQIKMLGFNHVDQLLRLVDVLIVHFSCLLAPLRYTLLCDGLKKQGLGMVHYLF